MTPSTVSTPPAAFSSTQLLRFIRAVFTRGCVVLGRRRTAAGPTATTRCRSRASRGAGSVAGILTQTRRRTWYSVPSSIVDLHEPFESVGRVEDDRQQHTAAITPGSVQAEDGVVLAPTGGWGEGSLWTFDYVCGWAADDLPADIEQAVFQLAQTMYEQKTMPSDQIVRRGDGGRTYAPDRHRACRRFRGVPMSGQPSFFYTYKARGDLHETFNWFATQTAADAGAASAGRLANLGAVEIPNGWATGWIRNPDDGGVARAGRVPTWTS